MAKQKVEETVKELTVIEQYFYESNRGMTDEQMSKIMGRDVAEVKLQRADLGLEYEQQVVKPKDLSFNKTLQQWEDADGNVYNGPAVTAEDVKETVEIKRQVAAGIKAGNLIARNDKNTAAVMTAGASQMSDMIRTKQRLIPTCVHQPRVRR
jgi:hypothetical protein